jgi:uncharacterized protein
VTAPAAGMVSARPTTAQVTAVSCFRPTGDRAGFRSWAERVLDSAAAAPGHRSGRIGMVEAAELDWAIVTTFDDEEQLNRWLDGDARRTLLADGRALGLERVTTDVVVGPELPPGTGVGLFWHAVKAGREDDFVVTQNRLMSLSATFPGFEGATLIAPGGGAQEWMSVLRFRTDRQLRSWMDSGERAEALSTLRSQLTKDFSVITRSTAFGSILRVEDGVAKVTPQWKSALLVLLVLYPTVMILSRFLGPVLDGWGAEPWLSMWLSQIVSVGLMSFLLMPAVTWLFRRWLDPVRGAAAGVTLLGVGLIVLTYLVTLTIFASVTWLQFWQHPN